jgi:hypothetical protein
MFAFSILRRCKILEDWKIRVSVLWLFYAVAFLAALSLGSLEPGVLSKFIETGQIGGMTIDQGLLFLFAVLILVPLIMSFMSLNLKDSANRWANAVVGVVYTGFQIVALAEILMQPSAYAVLIETSKVVVPALIVWYAWKSKQKA